MLALTRKVGQNIILTDKNQTTIKVVSIDRGTVVLAFDAPSEVRIDREEIHEKKLKGVPFNKK